MAFVVNAHHGGTFAAVETACAMISEAQGPGLPPTPLVDCMIGGGGTNTGVLVGLIYRRDGQMGGPWMFKNVNEMCIGKDFLEAMPVVRRVIDSMVDPFLLVVRDTEGDLT